MRREQYVGPWLPEPVLGEQAQEIGGQAGLEDSLSMAFLVLLESIRAIRLVVNPEKLPNVPPLERTESEGDSR
jgi:RNA polymerase sigma-70 factor, ECF subfamily